MLILENTYFNEVSNSFTLTKFKVGDNGLEATGNRVTIPIVRGSKLPHQNTPGNKIEGVLPEQLIECCIQYLQRVNSGKLQNEHTDNAIKSLNDARLSLLDRQMDRRRRKVQATYNK